jgi:hypothetical protein
MDRAKDNREIGRAKENLEMHPPDRDVWEPGNDDNWNRTIRERIDYQAWGQVGRSMRLRIERGPRAALVWFHADPEAVLKALYGGPVPALGEPTYPLLFAPGLPHLYRAATAEEVALWNRLPMEDAVADATVERLLAEGIIAEAE